MLYQTCQQEPVLLKLTSYCPDGEMADALASGASVRKDMGVRLSLWAQLYDKIKSEILWISKRRDR